MFRAALFSIVLTLAVGQNAGLLCTVWCPDATSTACPHQEPTTTTSVRTDETCASVAVEAVGFIREDGRRTAQGAGSLNALVVRRFRFVSPPPQPRLGYGPGPRALFDDRPLVTALRL